jgi:hypothetical protein
VISIWDATYVYIEKSSNYQFHRSTYSMHKYRNLVKFMMSVATDGYIKDAVGPYLANGKNNDANITIDMFKTFFKTAVCSMIILGGYYIIFFSIP